MNTPYVPEEVTFNRGDEVTFITANHHVKTGTVEEEFFDTDTGKWRVRIRYLSKLGTAFLSAPDRD